MRASRMKTPPSSSHGAIQIDLGETVSILEKLRVAILKRVMARFTVGRLTVHTPGGTTLTRVADTGQGPAATLIIHRWRTLTRLMVHGDIGFAESYLDGDWSSPDIAALIEMAALNRASLHDTLEGSMPTRLVDGMSHRRRANSKSGSRRNIMAHYDLGNHFYKTWLDQTMLYSSALYDRDDGEDSLEAAQARKLEAIIERLNLKGGEKVLEIGCGWGALAIRLAEVGCHVTALTLSPAQYELTVQRVSDAGWGDQIDVRLQDYRDVTGQFDRIVSIEMFEAVGQAYWDTYFRQLKQCLVPGGIVVLQVITINEQRFESYRHDVDFIQRYIFPGGMLPTPRHIADLSQSVGMQQVDTIQFGLSYAATLNEWHRRFQNAWTDLRHQGFDERFKRLWEYYLKYCEGGFKAGAIDVGLYVLHAPPSK